MIESSVPVSERIYVEFAVVLEVAVVTLLTN